MGTIPQDIMLLGVIVVTCVALTFIFGLMFVLAYMDRCRACGSIFTSQTVTATRDPRDPARTRYLIRRTCRSCRHTMERRDESYRGRFTDGEWRPV